MKYSMFILLGILFALGVSCNKADQSGIASVEDIKQGVTATIVLQRRKQKYLGVVADVNIYVNEKGCGVIKNGEFKEIEFKPLSSGNNSIRLEAAGAELMDMLEAYDPKINTKTRKTIEFTARPGEKVSFICNYGTELTFSPVDNEVLED